MDDQGPWTKYQSSASAVSDGPWNKYKAPEPEPKLEETPKDDSYTGTILPFRQDKEGMHLAVPTAIQGLIDTAKSPGDVLAGKLQPSSKEMNDKALDFAGMIAGGSKAPELPKAKEIAKDTIKDTVEVVKDVSKAAKEGVKTRTEDLKTGYHARTAEQLDTQANAMRQKASGVLKSANIADRHIDPKSAQKLPGQVDRAMTEKGLTNKRLHGDTLSVVKDLKDTVKKGNVSLETIEQHRQLLRQVIKKNTSKIDGANPEVPHAMAAINAIDKFLDNLEDKDFFAQNGTSNEGPRAVGLVKIYREEWARARRFERVSDLITSAKGDATKIKNNLDKFVSNPENLNGFTEKEKAALKKAAHSGAGDKVLKLAGTAGFNPAKSNLGGIIPGVEALAGGAFHVPGALPAVAAGTGANLYRNMITKGQAENVLRLIQGMQNP